MALPLFTQAGPGLARSYVIRVAPQDEHILNPRSWQLLSQCAGLWLRQYLQNPTMLVCCGMAKMVQNDFEQAVVIFLTYAKGRAKQAVANSVTASLMQFAGPPVEGFAVLGQWASLKWVREVNRHVQRRFGLGDAFAVAGAMDAVEASRALYGLGDHQAFLEDAGVYLPALFALTPAEPPLALGDRAAECEHDWVSVPSSAHRLYPDDVLASMTNLERVLCALSRSRTVLHNPTVAGLVCEFVAGLPMAFASRCEACGMPANTYCRCNKCLVVWCSSCLSGERVRAHNRQQPVVLREEARALLREDYAREIHMTHQSHVGPGVFFVTDVVASNEERAEWFLFELQKTDADEEDLVEVAGLFRRFLGGRVRSNQQAAALKIYGLMSGEQIKAEGDIRPFSLQEAFARVWNPSVNLCHRCGSALIGGSCRNDGCGERASCAICGSTTGRAWGAALFKVYYCDQGHYLGFAWHMRHMYGQPTPTRISDSWLETLAVVAASTSRARAANRPR